MEFIEQKPIVPKKNAKLKKIIITSVVSAVSLTAIALAYFFAIKYVFLDYSNINLYTYSYQYDLPKEEIGVRIDSIKTDNIPSKLRIPEKLGGYPVVEIGDGVFETVQGLEEIVFPATLETIGYHAFFQCEDLVRFNAPKALRNIGTEAFHETKWLEEQDDGAIVIGDFLYTYQGQLGEDSGVAAVVGSPYSPEKYPSIPSDAEVLDLSAFVNLSSGVFKDQEYITYVEMPEKFDNVYESSFQHCGALETVVLPDSIRNVGDFAFTGCNALTNITWSKNLESIGEYAFSDTRISGAIELGNSLSSLGDGAFQNCPEITKVSIPEDLYYIPSYAFENCSKLAEVSYASREHTKESYISYIGKYAFSGTAISDMMIPFNVESIQEGAFKACPNLTTVRMYNNTTNEQSIQRVVSDTGEVSYEKIDGSHKGVIKIDSFCFEECTNFDSLVLVDENKVDITPMHEVNLPLTLTALGGSNVQSSMFSKTNISKLVLWQDRSLIDPSLSEYIKYCSNNNVKYVAPLLCANASNLSVVDFGTSENSHLEAIYLQAFLNCNKIVSIHLPDTISKINEEAFKGCTSLKNITFSSNLEGLTNNVFEGCGDLESITIPDSVVSINDSAFAGCDSLNQVIFGEKSKLAYIYPNAFLNCSNLTSFFAPSTLRTIHKAAFKGCTSLTTIELNENTSFNLISEECFAATGLVEVSLPKTIKTISQKAFENAEGLMILTLNSTSVVKLNDVNAFAGTKLANETGEIRVPSDLLEAYKADAKWSEFATNIVAIS